MLVDYCILQRYSYLAGTHLSTTFVGKFLLRGVTVYRHGVCSVMGLGLKLLSIGCKAYNGPERAFARFGGFQGM